MGNCKNCFKSQAAGTSPLRNSGGTVKNHISTDAFPTEQNEVINKDEKTLLSKNRNSLNPNIFDAPSAKIIEKIKTDDEVKLIKNVLSQHFLFSYFHENHLNKIVKIMKFYSLDAQQIVFEQGKLGCTFFVLRKGILEILVNGDKKGFFTAGHAFGELALINSIARTATVRSLSKSELWGLDQKAFKKALKAVNAVNFKENKAFIQSLSYFQCLKAAQIDELLTKVVSQSYNDHQKIIIEGETGEFFYIIQEGQVECSVKLKKIRNLTTGEYFGELALIYDACRSATVVSIGKTKLLSFAKETLKCVLGEGFRMMLYRNSLRIAFERCEYLKQLTQAQVEKIIDKAEFFSYRQNEIAIPQGVNKGKYLSVVVKGSIFTTKRIIEMFEVLGVKSIYMQKFSVYRENFISVTDSDIAMIKTERLVDVLGCGLAEKIQLNVTVELLKQVPLFRMLSEEKLVLLAKSAKNEEFQADTQVFKNGDKGDCLYIIKEGEVKIHKDGTFIRVLSQNSYFGERSILLTENRTASVTCTQKSVLLSLNREHFLSIIDKKLFNLLLQRMFLQDDSVQLHNLIILSLLGKGAFGKVYLCHNPQSQALYALKVIPKKKIHFHSLHENLKHEKTILQRLDHQFIIKLVKTFKDSTNIYFLLEHIQGLTLNDVLRILNLLNSEDCKFYFVCLLSIFEYLHKNSIVYRDLKPENVMVDLDGYLKLIDFGTAKIIQERTFSVIGTPHYMAPEVITGKGYSFSADLWSLGVVLYEFVCGTVPFGADETEDLFSVYREILKGKIVYPSFVKKNLREKKIIERLLDLTPLGRGTAEGLKGHKWFGMEYWSGIQNRTLKGPYMPTIEVDLRNLKVCVEENRTVSFILNEKKETDSLALRVQGKQYNKDWDKDF